MASMRAKCPECEAWVPLPKEATEGKIVVCPGCGEQLELINMEPPELDYAVWEEE